MNLKLENIMFDYDGEEETFCINMQALFGETYDRQVDVLFTRSVHLAANGNLEEAVPYAETSIFCYKFCNNDKKSLAYIYGFLCHIHIDMEEYEKAQKYFEIGFQYLDEDDFDYENDVNKFLDMKIIIDYYFNN